MKNQIMLEAEQLLDEMTAWRRRLHQIPEIGLTLPKTVAFITKKLEEMDIKYTVYEDSSNIVACIGQGDTCLRWSAMRTNLPGAGKSSMKLMIR